MKKRKDEEMKRRKSKDAKAQGCIPPFLCDKKTSFTVKKHSKLS